VETYAFGTKGLRDSWLHHAGVLRHHARTLVRSAGGCPGYHSRASFEKVSINLIIGRPAGPATANIDVGHQSSRHVCWELEAGIPSIFRRRPRQQSDGRCESRWEEGREVDRRREVGRANAAIFAAPPATTKTSSSRTTKTTTSHHVPEQSIPCCRSGRDTHSTRLCAMDADVVHLPSLLSLGGPRSVLSPAQTSSITQTASLHVGRDCPTYTMRAILSVKSAGRLASEGASCPQVGLR
jgi:hypothetical protein